MNCWILLVLLFCNGNCGMSGWGRRAISDCCDTDGCDSDNGCGCSDRRSSDNGCGCSDRRSSDNDCGCSDRRSSDNGCGCSDWRNSDRSCGCSDWRESNNRSNDCGCRTDVRNEARFESRPFVSFSGSTCGCEDARNDNDCDCCQ